MLFVLQMQQTYQENPSLCLFSLAAPDARSATAALRDGTSGLPKLAAKDFAGRTWLTRPRPEIDRVGSAWLIRKFLDPKARFVFAADRRRHPDALPFDILDVEFTHHGEDCTFETL